MTENQPEPTPGDNDQAETPQQPENVGDDAGVDEDGNEPGYEPGA
jgi:hypothetical protein